jgi:DNA polymerase-3 subunit beta
MKFICNKTRLHDAITNVSKAVAQKSNITALEGIKLKLTEGNLELTGFDLEFGIRTNLEVNSEGTGELVINSRLFSEIIRKMSSDDVTVAVDEKLNVNIAGNDTTYDISAMPPEEYPDFPTVEDEKYFEVPQYILKNMIEHTNHAVSVNDSKPILTGELFDISDDTFRMVAIDGFRLAVRTEPMVNAEQKNFVVPSKTLNEISKLLAKGDVSRSSSEETNPQNENSEKTELCRIYTSMKNIIFEISGYLVVSRLLEGEFHNYKKSLPESFVTEVIIKTKDFADSIERCSLLINEKNKKPVRCIFDSGVLKVDCKTTIGKINDSIPAEVNGPVIEIGFNNKFLLDALKACETDKIKLQLTAPNRPVKIIPTAGESFTYLLMPIQLKN